MSSNYLVSGDTVINKKLVYSIPEAAKQLGISDNTMRQLARTKGFPTIMIGNRILISVKGLEAWVEKQAELGWDGKYVE